MIFKRFQEFVKGVREMSFFWQGWMFLMVIVNGVIPIFFLPKISAAIVLTSALSGLILGILLTLVTGFNKFLGVMHLPWLPMVVYQVQFLYFAKIDSNHDYWLAISFFISVISLVIDFYDVSIFMKARNN